MSYYKYAGIFLAEIIMLDIYRPKCRLYFHFLKFFEKI